MGNKQPSIPKVHQSKRALIISYCYRGTEYELPSCNSDASIIKNILL